MPEPRELLMRVAEEAPHRLPTPATEVRRLGDRRRHRRTAQLVAAALVVVAAGAVGISLAQGDGPRAAMPVGQPTPSATTAVDVGPAPTTLGHGGIGRLRLGMTLAQAQATGQIEVLQHSPAAPPCRGFTLRTLPPPHAASVDGYLDPTYGIVAIFARQGIRTPEGVGLGSTAAQVEAAYPHLDKGVNGWFAWLSGNRSHTGPGYEFIVAQGKVTELSVQMASSNCFG